MQLKQNKAVPWGLFFVLSKIVPYKILYCESNV